MTRVDRFVFRTGLGASETQDAAADLGARFLGLCRLDQPTRHVTAEFGKLIAIDFEIVIRGGGTPLDPSDQRQKHRQASAEREGCGYDAEQHGSSN